MGNQEMGSGKGKRGTYGDAEFLGQSIYFCVLEKLRAGFVDGGYRWVGDESASREFGGEIFAGVEVFEEAAYGFHIGVGEVDAV